MRPLPEPLPHGVVADEVTLANGERTTVYRAPFQVEGPIRFQGLGGALVLAFRFANFVFVWPEDRRTVDISHGTIGGGQNMVMFRGVAIEGEWSETTLADFGTVWARERLARGRRVNGVVTRCPVA